MIVSHIYDYYCMLKSSVVNTFINHLIDDSTKLSSVHCVRENSLILFGYRTGVAIAMVVVLTKAQLEGDSNFILIAWFTPLLSVIDEDYVFL